MPTPDQRRNTPESQNDLTAGERLSSVPNDLPESQNDRAHLGREETVINLPDVSDIPGQEHVTVPQMESFMDSTIASDDEEGDRIFSADNEVHSAGTSRPSGDEARTAIGERDQDNPDGPDADAVQGTP